MVFTTEDDRLASHGEFLERIAAASSQLSERLPRGSRVACLLGNTLEYLVLRYALSCAGHVEVAVNGQHRGDVLRHMLDHSKPDAIVVADAFRPNLDACGFDGSRLTFLDEATLREITASRRPWEERPRVEIAPGDCCRILFTSGTGGRSKAVELSHAYEVYTGERHLDLMSIGPGDRWLYVTPLFHIDAIYIASILLHTGAALALAPGFSLTRFWDDVALSRASHLCYVGSILAILLKGDRTPASHTLRTGIGGGARPKDAADFEGRFGVEILESYAMTECIACTFNTSADRRAGSIGTAVPGYEVAILEPDGSRAAPDALGEIAVRTDEPFGLFTRYVGDREATATAMRGGWFHTGDLGSQDKDGYVYYRGRLKDSIRVRGENVSALELESIVDSHPGVQASAAVAVPSDVGDDDILLYVEPRPGSTVEPGNVFAYLAGRTARFMWPRYVKLSEALPRTATEKIRKSELDRDVTKDVWTRPRSHPAEHEEGPGERDDEPTP